MPTVVFSGILRRHLPVPDRTVDGTTVAAALDAVFADAPRLRGYVLDDQGALRRHVTVYVGERAVGDRRGLSDPVAPADAIYVLQALSGG